MAYKHCSESEVACMEKMQKDKETNTNKQMERCSDESPVEDN